MSYLRLNLHIIDQYVHQKIKLETLLTSLLHEKHLRNFVDKGFHLLVKELKLLKTIKTCNIQRIIPKVP